MKNRKPPICDQNLPRSGSHDCASRWLEEGGGGGSTVLTKKADTLKPPERNPIEKRPG